MIPLSAPVVSGNEWKYVKECLDTAWVSSAGKYVNQFENNIAQYTGAKNAVALTSGTAALHLAYLGVGVQPGDAILIPTVTFIATVNAAMYVGAYPIFFDCDEYYNIDSEKLIEYISTETYFKNGFTFDKNTNLRIAAIVVVHVFGNACRLSELLDLLNERNIKIVEDATESLGTKYNTGQHTGTLGLVSALSFNGNKIITTGGGGILLSNSDSLASKARYLSTQAKEDEVKYIHGDIGYNYRLTNLQAAMGVAQLEQLDQFIANKKQNYNLYKKFLNDIEGIKVADVPDYAQNNYWLTAILIDENSFGMNNLSLMNFLQSKGVQSRPLWLPCHLQEMFSTYPQYKIEKAIELHKLTLNIPSSSNLTKDELMQVVEAIQEAKHSTEK